MPSSNSRPLGDGAGRSIDNPQIIDPQSRDWRSDGLPGCPLSSPWSPPADDSGPPNLEFVGGERPCTSELNRFDLCLYIINNKQLIALDLHAFQALETLVHARFYGILPALVKKTQESSCNLI